MTAVVLPDIEDRLIDYLATVPAITNLVGTRVYAELVGTTYPVLTVRLLSSRAGVPRYWTDATFEVAGWASRNDANGRSAARLVAETAVAVLNDLSNRILGNAVVAGPVATFGPRSVPDQLESGVTNPRWIAEVTLPYRPL